MQIVEERGLNNASDDDDDDDDVDDDHDVYLYCLLHIMLLKIISIIYLINHFRNK